MLIDRRIGDPERSDEDANLLRELQAAEDGPLLAGRWHHGGGFLVCGTIRVAKADFDTSPPQAVQETIFDEICEALNSSRLGIQ